MQSTSFEVLNTYAWSEFHLEPLGEKRSDQNKAEIGSNQGGLPLSSWPVRTRRLGSLVDSAVCDPREGGHLSVECCEVIDAELIEASMTARSGQH